MDVVAPELRAVAVYGRQTDVGTYVDAIMMIVSQSQEYLPSKVRSDAIATHDDGNDRNERTPALVRHQIVKAVDRKPRAPGSEGLSNFSDVIERSPEPPVEIMVVTCSQLV